MTRYQAGYQGHDAMRAKAERELMPHIDREHFKKGGHVKHRAKSNCEHKVNMERHGGHSKTHGMNKDQTNMHIPHRVKHAEMKKGGHAHKKSHGRHHMNFGGMLSEAMQPQESFAPRNQPNMPSGMAMKRGGHAHKKRHMAEGGEMPFSTAPVSDPVMKRGGRVHKKHHYAMGGDVYEREMVGEHPSRAPRHSNYENIMRGTRPSHQHTAMKHGGHAKHAHGHKKMAIGGIGKYRHGEATLSGSPKSHKRDMGK